MEAIDKLVQEFNDEVIHQGWGTCTDNLDDAKAAVKWIMENMGRLNDVYRSQQARTP